jgi:2-keto-4-pentenoate hydratase/2-oxohepta-3-ene-1,7-dioic acid hydratase in catechol pathway
MRLVSYRQAGDEDGAWRAGIVVGDRIVDAADCSGPVAGDVATVRGILALSDGQREALAAAARAAAGDGLRRAAVVLGPPVPDPDKILCIGLNYSEHAEETELDPAAVPTVFAKFRNSLAGSDALIVAPAATEQVDFEGEVAVVIGRRCRRVRRNEALAHVAGVMPLNDVSARDLQFQASQWTAGKAVDTFAPCGPELVLLDEIDDLDDLRLRTRVNGEVVQDARTSQMIFDIPRIIEFLSSFLTLEVGDVIATGTPAGVGFTREPPLLLADGDLVEVEIDGIGVLRNAVEHETALVL